MDGALNQFGGNMPKATDPMYNAPATNPLVNVSSMSPTAMANLQGSPLSNQGSNMMPYLTMQETFTPKPLQSSSSSSTYRTGGLVQLAEGGMPPPAPEQGGGLPAPQEGGEGEIDPQLLAEVEQAFAEHMDNPKAIADALLQLVMRKIKESVTPEQMEQLKTPEGQQLLQQELEKIMEQMKGGLGQAQDAGAAPAPGGAAPPPAGGALGAMA